MNHYRITTVDGNHATREADGPMDALAIFYSDYTVREQPDVARVELITELSDENSARRDDISAPVDVVVVQWRRTDEYCAKVTGKELDDLAAALGKPVTEIVEDDVVECLGEFLDSREDPNSNFYTGYTERTPLVVHFALGATPVDDAPEDDQ